MKVMIPVAHLLRAVKYVDAFRHNHAFQFASMLICYTRKSQVLIYDRSALINAVELFMT
ncbi:hypothetical protein Enr10x_00930 [Gimesia panareensis]|uniref:Uncharacterized protein n=1 Tax=Gimesia panareensis TaxID=2527978 RepID=A0A517PZJ0_9PLAN|nr:hypothetical protein Enr10x_00930 [Gimesia panareensis]QDU52246.1 hypothetical protein Pan110_46190 [Gimesia panareensis]